MKLSKFIFKHFAPIPSKQWKQKIQYELKGADYQTELVYTDSDGISTLPYYTHSDNSEVIEFNYTVKTSKAVHIIASESLVANQKALDFIKQGVDAIYFIIYDKEIDPQELLANIQVPVFINCYFLNVAFAEELQKKYKGKAITILTDPIGKLGQTGNWYRDTISDFEKLQQIVNLNGNSLSINMSLFHNAGASSVQQLAYGLSQLLTYSKQLALNSCKTINYQVSVGTHFFKEIAKLKVLRILHHSLCDYLKIDIKCQIIILKSKRNTQAINTKLNAIYAETEQLIGFAGNADIVTGLPEDTFFFKEESADWNVQMNDYLKRNWEEDALAFEDNIYIEKLSQQLLTKTSELINSMEEGGGFLAQFKKGILLQKIEQKAVAEQNTFKSNFKTSINSELLVGKTPISYPFFTYQNKKTQYKPIIEKRLAAPLEKPIWDSIYKND